MKKKKVKKIKLKNIKQEKKPIHRFKKGFDPTKLLTEENQCEYRFEDGRRCIKFKLKGKNLCYWHQQKNQVGSIGRVNLKSKNYSTWDWIKKIGLMKNFEEFSLEDYPFMIPIFKDRHPDKVIMKSTQVSVTEYAMIDAIAFCNSNKGVTALYTFPSRDLASVNSKQRIDPLFSENRSILVRTDEKAKDELKRRRHSHYESVFMKQIGTSFMILQGAQKETQTISTPADYLINDEWDFSKQSILQGFITRLGNSNHKYQLRFSNPTIPEWGIHKLFLDSDQHHYWYTCEHCGYRFKLCCSYPEVIQYSEEQERYYFGCPECKKEIARRKNGEWIPENPGHSRRGYHVTRLIAPRVSAQDIIDEKESYHLEKDFYSKTLGLPYEGGSDRLVLPDIEACEDERYTIKFNENHTAMGVDQGGQELFPIILKPMKNGKLQLIYIDHLKGLNSWKELSLMMKQFGVARCVVDGLPDNFKANEFAAAHKGRVYLNFYEKSQGAFTIKWKPKERLVKTDRTGSLEKVLDTIKSRKIVIPISDRTQMFKKHLLALLKVKEEDPETGEITYSFKKVKNDHFAHSLNYALTASNKMEIKDFELVAVSMDNEGDKNKGSYSDEVVNALAKLVYMKKINQQDIAEYRCNKNNGQFVDNMNIRDEVKIFFSKLEIKFGVRILRDSIADLDVIKSRVNIVTEPLDFLEVQDE